MGHRKNNGRNSLPQGRRAPSLGARAPPSSMPLGPLSHSSPIRQMNRPTRRSLWGSGASHGSCNTNEDKSSQYASNETFMWTTNFANSNRSPNSLSIGSDGCHSISSDGASINSYNSDNSKHSNTSSNKKVSARPSNPLRYKTELCRSFEESGDCRFGAACTFAHGLRELRAVVRHPRYKTDLCRTYHGAGYCQYGARCHFVHDPEEAAGVAAMRGYKLRSFADGTNQTVLPTSENRNGSICLNANALILGNLQNLHTYRTSEPEIRFLDSSGCDKDLLNSIGKLNPDLLSLNLLTIDHNNASSLRSRSHPQANFFATKVPSESTSTNYMDSNSLDDEGNNIGLSTPSFDSNWWNAVVEPSTRYSFPCLDAVHNSPKTDSWRMGEVSASNKTVMNPMEVSRSLLIPSIRELIQMP